MGSSDTNGIASSPAKRPRLEEETPLWQHKDPESTQIYAFLQDVNKKHNLQLGNYSDLLQWSCQHPADFWEDVYQLAEVKGKRTSNKVFDENAPMFPRPNFFPDAKLNFAQNLLYPPSNPPEQSPALIGVSEDQPHEIVTWVQLRGRVSQLARSLRDKYRVGKDDRVAGLLANHAEAVVCMLAVTSLGAIWTGISPDTGVSAVLDRLEQVKPKLMFTDNGTRYKGKTFGLAEKVKQIASSAALAKTIFVHLCTIAGHHFENFDFSGCQSTTYDALISSSDNLESGTDVFELFPADQPVYILYSSGTTGAPKPIVHSSLGTLLQHRKEHSLHCDIRHGDRLFYYTTTTWMMWHWLVSGLAIGATLVLYDGAPNFPYDNMSLPILIDRLQIHHFGTSAKYLSILEQGNLRPWDSASSSPHSTATLGSLRSIFSTGSPLAPSTFHYVYNTLIPPSHPSPPMLGSITGGTDILSLFLGCSPLLPIYAGEIQAPCLGMSVRIYSSSASDEPGKDVTDLYQPGELVCTTPFPAQPAMFWPPGPEGEAKYRAAYFEEFEHADMAIVLSEANGTNGHVRNGTDGCERSKYMVWHHGDFLVRNPPPSSGFVMLGRSDTVLNPSGIRFGSSEIYNLLLRFFPSEVDDSICVGRRRPGIDDDETVCLFVKMKDGRDFNELGMEKRIKQKVAKELSLRHVPAIIREIKGGIPVTANGKKVEGVVKRIVNGTEAGMVAVSSVNGSANSSEKVKSLKKGAVANEECLEEYREIVRLLT